MTHFKIDKSLYGSNVKLTTNDEVIEGILIPSQNLDSIVIKLDNGYNIGVLNSNIKSIEKTKEGQTLKSFPEINLKQNKELPKVAFIPTGGTISSRLDYNTGGVTWLANPKQIFSMSPKINEIVNIETVDSPFMSGSENFDSKSWIESAKTIFKYVKDDSYKGVIYTQGTDTLHYTSAALSFMIQNLNKPVVMTYSQRSIDRGSTDAVLNLNAAAYAVHSKVPQVLVVGHKTSDDNTCQAIRGTKVKKMHTSRRDAFRPINEEALFDISKEGKITHINQNYNKTQKEKPKLIATFEDKTALIKYYPNMSPLIIDYYIENNYKGIVIEAFGLGNLADHESNKDLTKQIKKAIKAGISIIITSQTNYGRTNPLVYSTGRNTVASGAIYVNDMHTETAFIKLGWVLSQTTKPDEVKEMMLTNFAGEFNDNISENEFLN